MSKECILCNSSKLIKKKSFSASEIRDKYSSFLLDFNIDIFFEEDTLTLMQCGDCSIQFFEGAKPGDGLFYEKLQQFDWYYEQDKPEFDYVIDKIIDLKPYHILEVGAGKGAFLDKIKDAYKVKASEFNEIAIQVLQEKDIELDMDEDKYDMIVSFQVLEHVESPGEFLQTQLNKLVPGGYLIAMVPNNDSDYMKYLDDSNILDFPPHHWTRWNKNTLLNIANLYDLELVDYYEEKIRLVHYEQIIEYIRRQLPLYGLFENVERIESQKELIKIINKSILPFEYLKNNLIGHTHGVVLRKKI